MAQTQTQQFSIQEGNKALVREASSAGEAALEVLSNCGSRGGVDDHWLISAIEDL